MARGAVQRPRQPRHLSASRQELLGVAVGGAVGAVLRWWLGELVPDAAGFPWATFAVNVSGAAGLAALPALALVRRRPALAAALGPGLLGGYTTLSAYAEDARELLAADRVGAAVAYLAGTLAACLVAAAAMGRLARGRVDP